MAKKGEKKSHQKKLSNQEIQLAVLENFVGLQKALVDMSIKFDLLSNNISGLLALFEEATKTFMKKYEEKDPAIEDKNLINKLDTLLEQNKTIAKGLTLIEEKIKHKIYPEEVISKADDHSLGVMGRPRPRPLPKI
jgi:hypothetical protein